MRPHRLTRVEQQAQTRDALLAAAERVISRQGYGGASLDLISAEAGYSKGAVYSNFESKEAIFLELLRRSMSRDLAELDQLSRRPGGVDGAIAEWLENKQADTECALLLAELQLQARRSPAFAEQYFALQAGQIERLATILERRCQEIGRAPAMPASDLASILIATAAGVPLQRPAAEAASAGRVVSMLLAQLMGGPNSNTD